jgi:sarcosine oxidase, subunit gamma
LIPKEPVVTVDTSTTSIPLVAHSPLDGHVSAFAAIARSDVRLRVLPATVTFNVRTGRGGAATERLEAVLGSAIPSGPSWVATQSGGSVVWLGPDELLVTAAGCDSDLEERLRSAVVGHGGSVTDQSGQRVSIEVTGDAAGLLHKLTAVDLHPRASPVGTAVQSFLGQSVVVFIVRTEQPSVIEVLVRASFARYAADLLLDACTDPLAYPADAAPA